MGCKLPRPGAAPGKSSSEDLTAGHGKRGDAEAALLHQGVRRTLRNDPGVGTARTTGHRKWRPELGGVWGCPQAAGRGTFPAYPGSWLTKEEAPWRCPKPALFHEARRYSRLSPSGFPVNGLASKPAPTHFGAKSLEDSRPEARPAPSTTTRMRAPAVSGRRAP